MMNRLFIRALLALSLILPALAPAQIVNPKFLQSGSGAVARTYLEKTRENLISVKDFGAKGDGVTDDTAAINKALTAVNHANQYTNKIVWFPSGKYIVTSMLTIPANVIFEGVGRWTSVDHPLGSIIEGKHTGAAVISFIGRNLSGLRNIHVRGSSVTTPKTVITLGRATAASAGGHIFDNVTIGGSSTLATVYSIASEGNTWRDSTIINEGGGAKYALYTAQGDSLSVGGLTGSSNILHHYNNVFFQNMSTDAAASTIYIAGGLATFYMQFISGYVVASTGSYVTIETGATDAGDTPGPIQFIGMGGEKTGSGALTQAFLIAAGPARAINGLTILDSAFTADTYYINVTSNFSALQGAFIRADPKKPSVFSTLYHSEIYLPSQDITVGNNATNNLFLYGGTLTLNGGVNLGNVKRNLTTNGIDTSLTKVTVAWDAPNMAAGAGTSTTVSVPFAALGDRVSVSTDFDMQGIVMSAYVQSAGNVTIALFNATAGALNFPSINYTLAVYR
jgi:hypothetical protein